MSLLQIQNHFLVMLSALPKLFQCSAGRKSLICFAPVLGAAQFAVRDKHAHSGGIKEAQATALWVLETSLAYGLKGHKLMIL